LATTNKEYIRQVFNIHSLKSFKRCNLTIIIAIILGIIQGLTEFLPISSSGHLVLASQMFNIYESSILFSIILHLGTLFAVLFVFRTQVIELIKHPFQKRGKMLVLASIITITLAILFNDFFEKAFNGELLAFSFLLTASFLIVAEYVAKKYKNSKSLSFTNTAVMGLFQGMAILPGVSRSGATISSAVVQGVNKKDAAEFSFLMSAPIIIASLVWELFKVSGQNLSLQVMPAIIGFLTAALFGVFAIKIMLRVINSAKYFYFSVYLIVLSMFLVLNQYVFLWF
jgi:undecaprenyl-diphosphatase